MNVNSVKPGGAEGPNRPEKGRVERVDANRRPVENKPVPANPVVGNDRIDLSNQAANFESRAKELAEHLVHAEDDRRAKVERAKKLVANGQIDSREHYEKAADALLAEVNQSGRKG